MTTYPTGPELLRQAVNQIIAHPETWDQEHWHCGTKHCIGGWCQILGGRKQDSSNEVKYDLVKLLDITVEECHWLTRSTRPFGDIYYFAKRLLAGKENRYAGPSDFPPLQLAPVREDVEAAR